MGVALIQQENKVQLLVYYVNQVFQGAKVKYPHMEKIVFALIVASRKLHPYFQVNLILVMMDQTRKKAMKKPEAAGRLVQWVIELSQFDIEYHPRIAIRAQALVDFIVEFTIPDNGKMQDSSDSWTIQTDGSLIQKRGAVVVIKMPEGETLSYGVRLQFPITNNEVEYKAILTGLKIGRALGAKNILLKSNSKLVVG